MPIKLPKGFQRRKSSGNALEEVRNPPESSFRVLERPGSNRKSFDGGLTMRMASAGPPKPPPKDQLAHEDDELFSSGRLDANNRGSGGTERSHSTNPNDSAASSTRLSTSSTNPSSIDTRSDKNVQGAGTKPSDDMPTPPAPPTRFGIFRTPGRNRSFSFEADHESGGSSAPPTGGLPPVVDNRRNRTVTTSSTSTATPPRLVDSDLALENSELDGFGNMFDHIRSSPDPAPIRLIQQETSTSSPTSYPPTSYPGAGTLRTGRAPIPRPISIDRSQVVESSPYSWASQDSHDGLMRSPSPSKTITQGSPAKSAPNPNQPSTYRTMYQGNLAARKAVGGQRPPNEEEDATPASFLQSDSAEGNRLSSSPTGQAASGTSPQSLHSEAFDSSIVADAELANMYQETKEPPPKPVFTNKVMTPAQWERYKEQKEMDRRLGALSDDSGSEPGDNYEEDDDDQERDRQAAKQRRKQEAHLAVYRQTMMKVTGETAPPRPESGLGLSRPISGSSPDINRFSNLTMESRQSGKSSGEDEEEDEDVPLGILAAHGFPNKNRPPTRLANSPSNPNMRSVSQTPGAPSVSQGQAGGNLPVFARHLPQDPYYGASLVNQSNRESLAMHSTLGAGPSTAHPIHPAGLVGVIAGEERARAARRGSPNPAGTYDMPGMVPHPGMVRSQTTGALPTMGYPPMAMPGMPPMMSPGDQAQMQMSQQMTQMMAMQMQWMQQMSHMMGGQFNSNPNPAMPLPGPPNNWAPESGSRPQSMHMQNVPPPQPNQRSMSTVNLSSAPWHSGQSFVPSINVNGNYAHSIAPSERSNVGLASRYRPVSIAPEPEIISHRRASTFTSTSARPWVQPHNPPRPPTHGAKSSVNTFGRRSPLANPDEDDDEQGWADMKMKKEKKQKSWALRKGQNPLQELFTNAS